MQRIGIKYGHHKKLAARPATGKKLKENRWCGRHQYYIDVDACRARAKNEALCRQCLGSWQQLLLPFL